jgi:O-antigen ligase
MSVDAPSAAQGRPREGASVLGGLIDTVRRIAAPIPDGVFLTLAFLTPLLSYFGNLAFSPVMAVLGLVSLVFLPRARIAIAGVLLISALTAFAVVSQHWSPYAPPSHLIRTAKDVEAQTALKMIIELVLYTAVVAGAITIRPRAARIGLDMLAAGFVLLCAVLFYEAANNEIIYRAIRAAAHQPVRPDLARRNVARACYELAILYFPVAVHLWRKGGILRAVSAGLGLATIATAFLLDVDAPAVAVAAGLCAFALFVFAGRLGSLVMGAGVSAYFILAPVAAGFIPESAAPVASAAKASWSARLTIWRFVGRLIDQQPFRGWGLDASRVFTSQIPLHPHNAALQIWFELGAAGAICMTLFMVWIITRLETARRSDPVAAGAGAASLAGYLVIGALSFGVWQEWWIALGALLFVVYFALRSEARAQSERGIGLEVIA